MADTLLTNEALIRLIVFSSVLISLILWERANPRRRLMYSRWIRQVNNLALVVLDTLALRLVFPVLAVGFAHQVHIQGWGLFNRIECPAWLAVLLSILVLDLAIYAQHVLLHSVPLLWRLHRVHHADPDVDATTGLRFHPIEILLSMSIKLGVVALLGPPAVAVLLFEILLNAGSLFTHANIKLPGYIERILRLVIVTPDMHRIHHSENPRETNSNYGFNLSWWDRLFRTYVATPAKGHEGMDIGIGQFRAQRELWLDKLLTQPMRTPNNHQKTVTSKRK